MNRIFMIIGVTWLLVAAFALSRNNLDNGLGVFLMPGFMGVMFLVLGFSGGDEPS